VAVPEGTICSCPTSSPALRAFLRLKCLNFKAQGILLQSPDTPVQKTDISAAS